MKDRGIRASDVDEEVVVVEGLKLDLHVRRLHDLVDLAVFLATDKVSMLVGEFDLELDLMAERLHTVSLAL